MIIKTINLLKVIVFSILIMTSSSVMGNIIFKPATPEQLEQAKKLFTKLFTQSSYEEARVQAEFLGFKWYENKNIIRLTDAHKSGFGEYYFSKHIKNGIVLQAPHRYHDKYTGSITKKLFNEHPFTSISLNSVSRYANAEKNYGADLAHLSASMHTAYIRAYQHQYPFGQVIQLHGFNSKKRRSERARKAQVILSNGQYNNTHYLIEIQQCLNSQGWNTANFPFQVKELGATKNSIAALLRTLGHQGFNHIELNLDSRNLLMHTTDKREKFAHCLLGDRL